MWYHIILYQGRVNALSPQADYQALFANVYSLPFMASRSEDRAGPAGVKMGQKILVFLGICDFPTLR